MKRLIFSFLLIVVLISAIVYFSASFLLTQFSSQGIRTIKQNAGKYGYQVHDITFNSAGLSSLNTVQWKGVTIDVEMIRGDRETASYRVKAEIENVSMSLISFKDKQIDLGLIHLKAFRVPGRNESTRKAKISKTIVKISKFKSRFKFDFMSVKLMKSDSRSIISDIRGLITHGRTLNPIEFQGNCLFGINGEAVTAGIAAEKRGDEYVVTMNSEDLRKISDMLDEDLNEPEIQLLSKNPLRAPKLLQIRNKARSKSEEAFSINRAISDDAYRHILWSYLLTMHYGETFAKLVADAHEQGDYEDSDADHRMDYHNNAIGRNYAKARLPESQVLQKAAVDPNVIGFVSEVR